MEDSRLQFDRVFLVALSVSFTLMSIGLAGNFGFFDRVSLPDSSTINFTTP